MNVTTFSLAVPTKAAITHSLRKFAFLALLLGSSVTSLAAGYTAQGGRIYDPGGQEIQIRGINHFGFNATILQPQYLWAMGWKEQIAEIKSLGFNAIRVPFVPDTLYNTTPVDGLSYVDPNRNPELLGKTPLQVLDLWMDEANRQGMYVLLDLHSVARGRQYQTWFVTNPADFGIVYNKQAYTKDDWLRDLTFVAQRYAHLPYFFGIDIYNEPNGVVRWSTGDANMTDPANYWKDAAESAAAAILAANPNLLIFVQGITGNFDHVEKSGISINWGENFQPQAYQPLNIPYDKLVLTPHTYGPDVFVKPSFSAPDFPANLAADWETLFGQFAQVYTVVPGEWGGRYGQGPGVPEDVVWQNAFVDYLLSKGISNSFYWCYTPNSGDTGGILDDSLNVQQSKMALLQRLWDGGALASGSTAPASGPSATAQGSTAPASGPAAPTQGSTAPASGPAAPTQGSTTPASGAAAPTQGSTAPTSGPAASTAGTPSTPPAATGASSTSASATRGGGGAIDPLFLLALAGATWLNRKRARRSPNRPSAAPKPADGPHASY